MDEYTVFVHRVVRSLEAAGLDEAAEEIRRTLLPAPDEGPGGEPPSEGDTTGPWSPRFQAPEGAPFTDAAADPDADADTFTPGSAESGAGERNQDRQETSEDDMAPPYFWDTSHSPHRPAAPRAQDEDDEDRS
ncbi:hypothetical protein ACIO8F_04030 [Streptomyces sp. NPDC087228]|uniref:hypothetical protein n=1 Tax=Streptomyces sp. NPDC087228 TaxID=3365772 RepID=UPI0037F2B5B4